MGGREVTVHLLDGFGAKCGVCVCWPVVNGPLLSPGRAGDRAVNCPDCLATGYAGKSPAVADQEVVNADPQ